MRCVAGRVSMCCKVMIWCMCFGVSSEYVSCRFSVCHLLMSISDTFYCSANERCMCRLVMLLQPVSIGQMRSFFCDILMDTFLEVAVGFVIVAKDVVDRFSV